MLTNMDTSQSFALFLRGLSNREHMVVEIFLRQAREMRVKRGGEPLDIEVDGLALLLSAADVLLSDYPAAKRQEFAEFVIDEIADALFLEQRGAEGHA